MAVSLGLGSCGSTGSDSSGDTVLVTSTAAATSSNEALLPGESLADGFRRLLNACMEPYGYSYTVTYPVGADGPFPFRVYEADPVVQQRQEACSAAASDDVGVQKLSAAQLEASWKYQTSLVTCLANKGYELGTPVSLEQFVAAGGVVDPASEFGEFGGIEQPNAAADYEACVAEVG
jgi:hypothetical protein